MSPKQSDSYYHLQPMEPSAHELDLNAQAWIQPIIIIEDEDLMFGGKPLSAWYEEDRSRITSSNSSDDGNQSPYEEEERRGRERTRRHCHDGKALNKTHRK
ncbi:hypothetical protein V8C34DRAFT_308606 [Trichoderma compactum]